MIYFFPFISQHRVFSDLISFIQSSVTDERRRNDLFTN